MKKPAEIAQGGLGTKKPAVGLATSKKRQIFGIAGL